MDITIDRLGYNVMSLARFVTATDYERANGMLCMVHDNPLQRGKWSCIVDEHDNRGYVFVSQDGSLGRSSRELPDQVDPKDVEIVKQRIADPAYGKTIIGDLLRLLEQLADGAKVCIAGSSESVNLLDPDSEKLGYLRTSLTLARRCIEPEYNENIVYQASQKITQTITLVPTEGIAPLQYALDEEANKIASLRGLCAADGRLTAWFLVYRDVCKTIQRHFEAMSEGKIRDMQFFRYAVSGSAGAVNDPLALLWMIVEKLVREGLAYLGDGIAAGYLQRGEDHIERSLESKSFDEHNAHLYTASHYLLASHQIYSRLVAVMDEKDENFGSCMKAQKAADEKLARAAHALTHAVKNQQGERFRLHRAQIEEARRENGELGASQKVFELIEMFYFYPRWYEDSLKGIGSA